MHGAAEFLIAIRRGEQPRPEALPPELAPRDEAEACTIQLQVLKNLGAYVGGWKASTPDGRSGQSAPIAVSNLLRDGARLAAPALVTQGSRRLGVEPEVAFTLARDLPPGHSYTRVQVLQAVASAHAAMEICVCRFRDFEAAPELDRLADNLMNEALVLSAPCMNWTALELKALPLRVLVDGATVHQAIGGHPLTDPVIPLVWLANSLSRRGIGLQAGDVVTTGSFNGIRYVPPGARVDVEFAELGLANIQL